MSDSGNMEWPYLEIVCPNGTAAKAEAARRQAEDGDDVVWIYLQRKADRAWVARRTPKHLSEYELEEGQRPTLVDRLIEWAVRTAWSWIQPSP